MYHHLRGKLIETGPMVVVVETGGIGFEVHVPLSTLEALAGGGEVFLYTHLRVREDEHRLYGFATRSERELFELMLSVQGVGPSIALAALSALAVPNLLGALAEGDAVAIRLVKGIGKRLAERLVVELRDRAALLLREAEPPDRAREGGDLPDPAEERVRSDAVAALTELGFALHPAQERVEGAFRSLREKGGELPRLDRLIREALR